MSQPAIDPSSELFARDDGPALRHFILQLVLTLATGAATLALAQADHPARWVALASFGVAVFAFFPLLHEAGHQTAFATGWLNEVGVWLGALAMLQAPSFFREFHWEHHRSTQDREADPEIASAPALLDAYPRDPITYLFLASGQFLLVGKAGFTLGCALLPRAVWQRVFPFIRDARARRVAWESRLALVVLGGAGIGGWMFVPGFPFALLAWPIAHLLLGLYVMPEHTGLANDGDQVHRTRTIRTNALVRALMWNMPYHAEHHAHPGVPYHALPMLHDRMADTLEHVTKGYAAFHTDAFLRAIRVR